MGSKDVFVEVDDDGEFFVLHLIQESYQVVMWVLVLAERASLLSCIGVVEVDESHRSHF